MPSEAANDVVVTGVGLYSPVGANAVQAAASLRAGLNRFRKWEMEGGVNASFFGPPLSLPWGERVLPLLRPPLVESLWQAKLFDPARLVVSGRPAKVETWVAVPAPARGNSSSQEVTELRESLGQQLLPGSSLAIRLIAADQAAEFVAIGEAIEALRKGQAEVCLVGAVDSLLDIDHLRALAGQGRLKTAETSSGLIPGEAAAAVVLELASTARRRKVEPLARLAAVRVEKAPPFRPEGPTRGEALTQVLRKVFLAIGEETSVERIIVDLNGERWRFLEWALTSTRCFEELRSEWELWRPADSLGDVGAAFGGVALILAVRGFARGYAGRGSVLAVASAESGERAALVVSPMPTTPSSAQTPTRTGGAIADLTAGASRETSAKGAL